MTKWDYRILCVWGQENAEDILGEYALEGWELVFATPDRRGVSPVKQVLYVFVLRHLKESTNDSRKLVSTCADVTD